MPTREWKNGATEQQIEDAADNPQSRRNRHSRFDNKPRKRMEKRTRTCQEADGHGLSSRNAGKSFESRALPWTSGGHCQRFQARSWKEHGGEGPRGENHEPSRKLVIALAGNANVGKSVIFNYLTGLHQHIGNWPGKTVEKAEGTLHFKGYTIDIIDLPGIYSLSTYSLEELVSRKYIAVERPDVVTNVVDASVLERNLFFTLQLIELETPMILALNQIDMAKKKGLEIDTEKLQNLLGVPVIPTIAIKGIGIFQLLEKALEIIEKGPVAEPVEVKYGEEVEERITELTKMVEKIQFWYPPRYAAIKLLEEDEEIAREVYEIDPQIVSTAKKLANEIENLHGHSCSTVITSERYEVAGRIAREAQKLVSPIRPPIEERLHNLTTHKILGYPIMAFTLLLMFYSIFTFGNYTSDLLSKFFNGSEPFFMNMFGTGIVGKLVWGGIIEGVIAGVTVALPYIVPFYIILYFLEDSGYLSRIAFLMDTAMHKIGLHGKAFIPVMLGYGCNVPACLGCRIMETDRERLLAAFVTTLVPCAARTVIILGLVGQFMGIQWALVLYVFNLLIIFALGRLAFRTLPGEPTALIMEMSDYRMPHLKTVLKQTWFRLAEFIKIAFPLIIIGSLVIKLAEVFGLLEPIATMLSPVTVTWLGLPAIIGITLIFGVLRKELALIMLATLLGTTNFAQVLTPVQMVVFTLVAMFYIPCVATIAALVREFSWKKALFMTIFEVIFAILIGGVAYRILSLFGIP
jgi:ferrous iron transport protein B